MASAAAVQIGHGLIAMKNPCLDVALTELAAVGIRDVEQARGGKHWQLRWRANGSPVRILNVPCTPSDRRAASNTRADVRRLLREDGLIESREPKPTPPPRKVDRITALERRVAELERRLFGTEHGGPVQ
jgi:hypothetical protein